MNTECKHVRPPRVSAMQSEWDTISAAENGLAASERQHALMLEHTKALVGKFIKEQRRTQRDVFYLLHHHDRFIYEYDCVLLVADVFGFLTHESPDGLTPVADHFEYDGPKEPAYQLRSFEDGQRVPSHFSILFKSFICPTKLLEVARLATRHFVQDFTEHPADSNTFKVTVHVVVGLHRARVAHFAPGLRSYFAKHTVNTEDEDDEASGMRQ